jgi:multicomponent Na+:H+ antiporter subunit A
VIVVLLSYAVVGVALVSFGGRLGRRACFLGFIPHVLALVWLIPRLDEITGGRVYSDRLTWVAQLDLAFDFRVDGLAATMTLIIAGVGLLVLWYTHGYFATNTPTVGRLAGLLVLFAGAMVGLVQSNNFYTFFTFWELTSVTSFLLIGIQHTQARARAAALHALVVTGAGGLALLAGFVLVNTETGASTFTQLSDAATPTGTLITVATVLLLLGAFTKSAQYPFHSWLPSAMAAPTPVSAYLHSATMVTAGVYLVARLAPVFATTSLWRPLVFVVGSVTVVAGGLRAIKQDDAKLMLALGTVSQLGFMIVLFGAGTSAAATAGWLLLVAQALFKASLFMVVGLLDRLTGTRDLQQIPVLGREWRWIEVTALVAAATMAGVPLTAGFIAKEADFESLADARFGGHWWLLVVVVIGSVLTAAYSARFWWCAFVAPRRRARADRDGHAPVVPGPSSSFGTPAALLAVGCLVLGLAPGSEDSLVSASIKGLYARAHSVHLAIWHGVNLELVLSVLALGSGILVFALYNRWRGAPRPRLHLPVGERAYFGTLRGIAWVSHRVTGVVQNGSLPVYAGVILTTAMALPAWVLVTRWDWNGWPTAIGRIGFLPIVGFLVVAALGAAVVRRRFAAALFLGAAGYAMAALFVAYGAPDLALTQVTVETLSTVVFVLVLRRLPGQFERQSTSRRRVVRALIAGFVGAVVFVFAIAASRDPMPASVSHEMVERSVPDGHGRNVVNVILVDFRGLDTLGEITVLAVAAIGAAALARVGIRARRERGGTPEPEPQPLPRLAFVDVMVQVMFFAVLVLSVWLLFAGHNEPGGGFVGGLLAGSAITLRYIAGGMREVRAQTRFRPWTVLGAGLLIAAATATAPLLTGGDVLEVAAHTVTVPLFGSMKLSSALLFDIGVYITVVGMVLMAFEAFGEDPAKAAP